VLSRHPQLGPRAPSNSRWQDAEHEEHFTAFVKAFRALGDFGRAEKPDFKHAAIFWVDRIEERLHADGISGGISLPPVTAAIVAHGDIPFAPLDRHPHDVSFGLRDGDVGTPASDGWRKILTTGKVA
jgi:hypothetical protein